MCELIKRRRCVGPHICEYPCAPAAKGYEATRNILREIWVLIFRSQDSCHKKDELLFGDTSGCRGIGIDPMCDPREYRFHLRRESKCWQITAAVPLLIQQHGALLEQFGAVLGDVPLATVQVTYKAKH